MSQFAPDLKMPVEPRHGHLLIIEDDKGRREFLLDRTMYTIGRDPQCDVRLISQFVSRRHATIVQLPKEDGGGDESGCHYRIIDGNLKGKPSANGILVNGKKVQVHDLKNADQIIFGPKVRAIYYYLQRDAIATIPPDEFDITLINPAMVEE